MSYGDNVKLHLHNRRMAELWQKIKQAREEAGLTQDQVAAICGLKSRNAVSLWECDDPERRTHPTLERLEAFSAATGKPMAWFFSESDDTPGMADIVSKLSDEAIAQLITSGKLKLPPKQAAELAESLIAQVREAL